MVLFLCVHNAGRSQMALGRFEHHAGDRAAGWSGGSEPHFPGKRDIDWELDDPDGKASPVSAPSATRSSAGCSS